jgi:SAM-dependent methyltransferase
MTLEEMTSIFRTHSRLSGSMAGNFETWLTDPGTLPRYQELILPPAPGETKMVELGCYQPSAGYYFKLGWREVVGIYKEEGEGTMQECYTQPDGGTVRFLMADVETQKIPIEDGWADVVVMMEIFEHFAIDPMHALWEANRILKPGGRLIFSTPNAASVNLLRKALRGTAPLSGFEFTGYCTNRHNRLYDAHELPGYLSAAGFAVDECFSRSYGHEGSKWRQILFTKLLRIWDGVASLLAPTGRKRERGHFIFVRARKSGAPVERYPDGLFFNPKDWPGMVEQREKFLQKQKGT